MKGHALIIIAVVGVLLVVATALDIFVLHVFSDEPPPAEPTALSKTPSEKAALPLRLPRFRQLHPKLIRPRPLRLHRAWRRTSRV